MTLKLRTDIFHHISNGHEFSFTVRVSVFELYKEEVYDLLSGKVISSRQDPKTRHLIDVTEKRVADYKSFVQLVSEANEGRKVRETNMNKNSSRSHVFYKISLFIQVYSDKLF